MSDLIDLGVRFHNNHNGISMQQSKTQTQTIYTKYMPTIKINMFISDFVEIISKTNSSNQSNSISYKNLNTLQTCMLMQHFHLIYSFSTKISFKIEQRCLKFQNLLLCSGRPFVIYTQSLRLAGIYLVNCLDNFSPGFKVMINVNNGLVYVVSTVTIQDQIITNSQISYLMLINFINNLKQNNEELIKIMSKIQNNFNLGNKKLPLHPAHSQKRSKILKYLQLSFLQLDISEVQLQHKKILSNEQMTQRLRYACHKPLDINQYEINKILKLYQNIPKNAIKIDNMTIDDHQIIDLSIYLHNPKAKLSNENDNQYIYNQIYIKSPHNINIVKLNMQGGNSMFDSTKLQFNYVPNVKYSMQQQRILQYCTYSSQKHLQKYLLIKNPINKQSQKYINHEQKIINILKYAHTAYMLKYYKTQQKCILQNKLMMDYNPKWKNLTQYTQKNKNTLSIVTKLQILADLSNGLRFLNSHHIVHMDLAPKNILIVSELLTKIIDFGQAYFEGVHKNNYNPGFTNPYGPPQVFTDKKFSTKQDSFSFGMIMFKLLFNHFPFEPTQQLIQCYKNKTYDKKIFFAIQHCNYIWLQTPMIMLISLFIRCKHIDPLYRPYPTWIRVILKMIIQWHKNIFYR